MGRYISSQSSWCSSAPVAVSDTMVLVGGNVVVVVVVVVSRLRPRLANEDKHYDGIMENYTNASHKMQQHN